MMDIDFFLESDYEDRNGDPVGNLFDEGWDAEIWEPDISDYLDEDDEE